MENMENVPVARPSRRQRKAPARLTMEAAKTKARSKATTLEVPEQSVFAKGSRLAKISPAAQRRATKLRRAPKKQSKANSAPQTAQEKRARAIDARRRAEMIQRKKRRDSNADWSTSSPAQSARSAISEDDEDIDVDGDLEMEDEAGAFTVKKSRQPLCLALSDSEDDQTRRAAKPTRQVLQCYADSDSDSDYGEFAYEVEVVEEPQRKVDKILGNREGKEGEYLIKWKESSYWHVEWVSHAELSDVAGGKQRVTNFWSKRKAKPAGVQEQRKVKRRKSLNRRASLGAAANAAALPGHDDMSGFFDPAYATIDRIVAASTYENEDGEEVTDYLCKWNSQQYDQSTWESEADITAHGSATLIAEYAARQELPPAKQRQPMDRPEASAFNSKLSLPAFKEEHLKLHDYQESGVKWLVSCWHAERSVILADEMGLGKTIQTVGILNYLNKAQGIRGPFLVVVPMSTLEQWKRELETWTDLNVAVLHGSAASRKAIIDHEFSFPAESYRLPGDGESLAPAKKRAAQQDRVFRLHKFNVLLTTFECTVQEQKTLSAVEWQYLVIDEGHRMKNPNSKLFLTLQGFFVEQSLILTGTPLQNSIKELWSMLHFLDPAQFAELEPFEAKFGKLTSAKQVQRLQKVLAPYLLRRMKEDVFTELPVKEETIIEIDLTTVQKTFYRAILDKNRDFLCQGGSKRSAPNLINIMIELRKCCNHPFLVTGAEEKITSQYFNMLPLAAPEDLQASDEEEKSRLALLHSSSKLIVLDKLLGKLRSEGHRVLIFSQMTQMLNILEDYLIDRTLPYERLDGSVNRTARQQAIDRFSNPSIDNFVFLLSTRAGGLGLNLTAADTVIIFDSDWNPQNDLQAQARSHRIGQTQDVMIYRLVTKDTYEQYMLSVASKKLGLEMAVLSSSGDTLTTAGSSTLKGMDVEEVDQLLKFGAYRMFNEDGADGDARMATEDIDSILATRAKRVQYEAAGDKQKSDVMGGLSTVTYHLDEGKKAAASAAVAVDDADFWQKVLPEFQTASALMEQLTREQDLAKVAAMEGAAPNCSLSTPAGQAEFMQNAMKVVTSLTESTEQHGQFHAFSNSSEIIKVRDLLNAIRTTEVFFTDEQRNQAGDALVKVQSRKRKRKQVQRNTYDEDLYMEPKAKKAKKNPRGKKAKAKDEEMAEADFVPPAPPRMAWTSTEFRKIKSALLRVGYGRWEQLHRELGCKKSVDEVRGMAETITQQLFGPSTEGSIRMVTPLPAKPAGDKPAAGAAAAAKKGRPEKTAFYGVVLEDGHTAALRTIPPVDLIQAEQPSSRISISSAAPEDGMYLPGETIDLQLGEEGECERSPLYLVVRLVEDDKKLANGEVVRIFDISFLSGTGEGMGINCPGFLGTYALQLWRPAYDAHLPAVPEGSPTFTVGAAAVLSKEKAISASRARHVSLQVETMLDLHMIHSFYNSEEEGNPRDLLTALAAVKTKKLHAPAWWWTAEHDLGLLEGIDRHGYGQIAALREEGGLPSEEDFPAFVTSAWDAFGLEQRVDSGYGPLKAYQTKEAAAATWVEEEKKGDGQKGAGQKKARLVDPFVFPENSKLSTYLRKLVVLLTAKRLELQGQE